MLNIIKENSRRNRGSGCGGRSRGQWFVAAVTVVAMVLAVNSGNAGGMQRWWKQRQHKGRQQSTMKR